MTLKVRGIRRHPAARDDMDAIVDYLREQDPEVALRFIESVRTTIESISYAPASFPRYETTDARLSSLRRRPMSGAFHKYIVFYRYDDDAVDIVRVLHCARNIAQILAGGL